MHIIPGHYPDKPGAKLPNGWSEHAEACAWVAHVLGVIGSAMAWPVGDSVVRATAVGSSALIEVHFGHIDEPSNPRLLYRPGCKESEELANGMQVIMQGIAPGLTIAVESGWYRGEEQRGPDFIFKAAHGPCVQFIPCRLNDSASVRAIGAELMARTIKELEISRG